MIYRISSKALAGPGRSGKTVSVKPPVKLVFFPGEKWVGNTLLGHIYVVGGGGEVYEACGGPEKPRPDRGHVAEPTPKGKYRLGPRHHHVTQNWSMSSLAWGTPIRQGAEEFEYQDPQGRWHLASGPKGKVTLAHFKELEKEKERSLRRDEREEAIIDVRRCFRMKNGQVLDKWYRNDFGEWAWNLPGTACYLHTTPQDELYWLLYKQDIALENSHGCVHLHPRERNDMMAKGYLRKGALFEVRAYGEQGPP